jgi:hypothetical protein
MKFNIYNIYGIISLAVSKELPFLNEIDSHLKFFLLEDDFFDLNNCEVLINSFENFKFDKNENQIVFDDYAFNNNFLIRESAGLAIGIINKRHEYYFSRLFLPVNLIIQLALLKKGFSFVHCASFRVGEKSFILPAFGGVGKTSILSFFAEKGEKIFGDDLCIIGNQMIYAYPQDMSIYDYHCKIFSNLPKNVHNYFFKRKIVKFLLSPLNILGSIPKKISNIFLARFFGECLNVSLERVFGKNCISGPSKIDFIIKLNKKTSKNLDKDMTLKFIDKIELAKFCTSVVINEWNNYFNLLLLIDSCLPNKANFSIELFFKTTNDIISQNFSNTPMYEINIDTSSSPDYINLNFNKIINTI